MTDSHLGWAKQISQANALNAADIPGVIKETITSLTTDIFWACMEGAITMENAG